MSIYIILAVLFAGLWFARNVSWAQCVWCDRIKPGVFLALAASLLGAAEMQSHLTAGLVASAGQYFVAAAAVLGAAIVSATAPGNGSDSPTDPQADAETDESAHEPDETA
ncbi:MAG: hypothetical protein CMJ78_18655 [Planctomycetaceae bacterium]|nr:hypothetical protein [Planctomycetaceae bacterium]